MSEPDRQAFLMKLGEKVYKTGDGGVACVTCHGPEGKGTPGAFPPLVGQKDHMKDCVTHAGYVLRGLTGEMVVDGVTYNGVMTPQADLLNDLQIAAVMSFERHSWGNDYGWCSPADVATARAAK
jgi:mono/diheme cytochrome c family protein